MCGGKSPAPAPTPAPAPAPPVDGPSAPQINEKRASDRNTLASSRNGRGSLRIDLAQSSPAGDGVGLNIPG